MLRSIQWLFVQIPWLWIGLMCLPWLGFLGLLLYTYYNIPVEDREGDVVGFFYAFGRLFYASLLQIPLLGCGVYWSRTCRKGKQAWLSIWTAVVGLVTAGIVGATFWFMYESYSVLYEQIQ